MPLAFNYCTDEDIAIRAAVDYVTICPDFQLLGSGTDGVFDAGLPWIMGSASFDFEAAGVHAGNVMLLTIPKARYGPQGSLFTIDSVQDHDVQLRRVGKPNEHGYPAAPDAGLSNVVWSIPTFDPQIDNASYDANRLAGIDPNIGDRDPDYIYDKRALRQFCVVHVLIRAVANAMRGGSGSHLQIRLAQLEGEFADLRDRIVVQWGTLGKGDMATSLFSTRARR